jgi:hypothetical protein
MHRTARVTRVSLVVSVLAFGALLSFAVGALVGRDRLASLLPVPLPLADAPPTWMSDYANAFCEADTAAVASRLDNRVGTADDVKVAFARREWKCDKVRYLGSSSGKEGTAYIFVLHDPFTGLYNWWVFTANEQKVVRID